MRVLVDYLHYALSVVCTPMNFLAEKRDHWPLNLLTGEWKFKIKIVCQ